MAMSERELVAVASLIAPHKREAIMAGQSINTLKDRFERHVMPEPMSGCWLWDGPTLPAPWQYGLLNVTASRTIKSTLRANRISYALHKGPIPDNREVCHSCDNPNCVNPVHLWLGTRSDNQADSGRKGRRQHTRKSHCKHGHAMVGQNVYIHPTTGKRNCRECRIERTRRSDERRKDRRNGNV